MRKVITSWEELTVFIKENKTKNYLLKPHKIYGTINQKKDVPEIRNILSVTLEIIEE